VKETMAKTSIKRISAQRGAKAAEVVAVAGTQIAVRSLGQILSRLNSTNISNGDLVNRLCSTTPNYLFDQFPALRRSVAWRSIGSLPTPVEEWPAPPGMQGGRFFVKRDDLTSQLQGGQKLRKLEHLFAEADRQGAQSLLAVGRIGSGQALAIAMHGRNLGFKVHLSLFDQYLTQHVREIHNAILQSGAQVRHAHSFIGCLWNARKMYLESCRSGKKPYFIASGATTTLGNVGYVNAGLEIARQVRDKLLPEPDRIFIAAGSCGTSGGLIVGLRLGGLASKIMAVKAFNPIVSSRTLIRTYAKGVNEYLSARDASLPKIPFTSDDVTVLTDYFGEGYGQPTSRATQAVEWAAPRIQLETTYTGKALAACLDYCRAQGKRQTILFWNTFCSPASFVPT
jgi:1-aminocyclopropane-1-carboxylate deaminase/D-cysteine desulfhydrase-like pyridoxal-dependent ACC family enzyme